VWILWRGRGGDEPAYRFATVERGDLAPTVSATGNLSTVTTVQVGTQVSGQGYYPTRTASLDPLKHCGTSRRLT
jgi:hypothetical protein